MSNLFVVKVKDVSIAEQMVATLKRLQSQQLIQVDDAAIVTLDAKGKPKIRQTRELVGAGALGGAFWGLLIGLLFFVPVFGALTGAAIGAVSARFADMGIDDNFVKTVGNSLHPGESALFLLTHGAVMDKVLPELKQYQVELIQSSLSQEDEARLREMIGATSTQQGQ